jgi:hypothetical protein
VLSVVIVSGPPTAAAVAEAAREQAPDADVLAAGPVALDGATHVEVPAAAGPAGALHAALGRTTGAGWVWVLDGRAVPGPGALAAMLAVEDVPDLPSPAVLASKVVLPGGALHPDVLPWPEIFEKEVSTAACAHRLVSLRAARGGSVLVRRDAIDRHGLPRADFVSHGEVLEWTARILRHEAGYLVPASVAVREDRDPPAVRRDLGNRARMLGGGAWRREEKLWFGFLLAQDAVRAAAGRA